MADKSVVPQDIWNSFLYTANNYARARIAGNVLLKLNFMDGRVSSWDVVCGQHGTCGVESATMLAITVAT